MTTTTTTMHLLMTTTTTTTTMHLLLLLLLLLLPAAFSEELVEERAKTYVEELATKKIHAIHAKEGGSQASRCKLNVRGSVYDLSMLKDAVDMGHHPTTKRPIDSPGSIVIEGASGGRFDVPHMRYTYYLSNLCDNVAIAPSECDHLPPAAAYQVSDPRPELFQDKKQMLQSQEGLKKSCHALGTARDPTTKNLIFSYAHIDESQPEVGVQLIYPLGENCTARRRVYSSGTSRSRMAWTTVPRELILNVRCDPGVDILARRTLRLQARDTNLETHPNRFDDDDGVLVSEVEMCQYKIDLPSKLGCPDKMGKAALQRIKHKREQHQKRQRYNNRFRQKRNGGSYYYAVLGWTALLCTVMFMGYRVWTRREWIVILKDGLSKGDARAWRRFLRELVKKENKNNNSPAGFGV